MKATFFRSYALLSLAIFLAAQLLALASSVVPLATAAHVAASATVFRGLVVGTDCYRDSSDGQLYTRTSLRVVETFKGTTPSIVAIVHPGGVLGDDAQYVGLSPLTKRGEVRLVFAQRRTDGKLTGTQGGASVIKLEIENGILSPAQENLLAKIRVLTNSGQIPGDDVRDQTGWVTSDLTAGLTDRGGGIAARYVTGDRGDPIPYLIDADHLPAGITLSQATNAVAQAFNAWSAVTRLKFRFTGIQSFGTNASAVNAGDETLRIQLHDDYNAINSVNTLGVGGQYTSAVLLGNPGWGAGGRVGTNEFFRSAAGFVVLERTNATMSDLETFTEVLTHEIGHVIGMAHSSNNPDELNNTLLESIMYFQVHGDNRGATLGSYDPPIIQQAYPTNNTPPYSYNRVMDVTTDSPTPNVAGINEIEVRGYDLQSTELTLATNNAANLNGSFTLTGSTLRYIPNDNFSDTTRSDPAGSSYRDLIHVRFSDGTNASAAMSLRVLSFNLDSSPSPTGDGIPNTWMTTYFGNASPTAGPNRGAQQDFDGDGLKNIDEYRTGMNPTNAASAQRITLLTQTNLQFQAKAYEQYELHASSNLTSWFRAINPVIPTSTTGEFSGFTTNAPHLFFRVEKVP